MAGLLFAYALFFNVPEGKVIMDYVRSAINGLLILGRFVLVLGLISGYLIARGRLLYGTAIDGVCVRIICSLGFEPRTNVDVSCNFSFVLTLGIALTTLQLSLMEQQ